MLYNDFDICPLFTFFKSHERKSLSVCDELELPSGVIVT